MLRSDPRTLALDLHYTTVRSTGTTLVPCALGHLFLTVTFAKTAVFFDGGFNE